MTPDQEALMVQLDLFTCIPSPPLPPRPPRPPRVPPYALGWVSCECGVDWWIWPRDFGFRSTAFSVVRDNLPPNLKPVKFWKCWRGFVRA